MGRTSRTFTLAFRTLRGGDGIRTHCLYIANVALYQLSYTPEEGPTLPQRRDWARRRELVRVAKAG